MLRQRLAACALRGTEKISPSSNSNLSLSLRSTAAATSLRPRLPAIATAISSSSSSSSSTLSGDVGILIHPHQQRRWLTPAPKRGDGPLLTRRADRELPDPRSSFFFFRWRRTLPFFLAAIVAGCLVIFNYQRSSSPVVASVLYALRTSPRAREVLGDDIYFARSLMPWISGEMTQLRGRFDISFAVRGSRGEAVVRFTSRRQRRRRSSSSSSSRDGEEGAPAEPTGSFYYYETTEWSLRTEDGRVVDLLEESAGPFGGLVCDQPLSTAPSSTSSVGGEQTQRGFRQSGVSAVNK